MVRRIRSFLSTSPLERRLFAAAFLLTVFFRITLFVMPFRRVIGWQGVPGLESPDAADPGSRPYREALHRALQLAGRCPVACDMLHALSHRQVAAAEEGPALHPLRRLPQGGGGSLRGACLASFIRCLDLGWRQSEPLRRTFVLFLRHPEQVQAYRMGICLNMIVRDEAARLPRLLASLEGVVDACVVCDTGSSDDTADLVRSWADRLGIPCRVAHHRWSDFASNRNLALEEALKSRAEGLHDCGWVMVIDADERIHVLDTAWKAALEPGHSYAVHVRSGGVSVVRPFLLDIRRTCWVWRGRVHNWVEDSKSENRFDFLRGVQVLTGGQDGAGAHPSRDPARKAEADRLALLEELQGSTRTADNAHRHFQLAYCCLLAGRHAEAAERMAALLQEPAVHTEIRYAAGLLAARAGSMSGSSDTKAMAWLRVAGSLASRRWEAPWRMAQILREAGDSGSALEMLPDTHLPRPTFEGTFWVEHDVYEWRLPYERAFLLHLNGRHADAIEAAASLLAEGCVPEPEAGFLRALLHRIGPI